jgi:hypothetical protein
MLAGGFRRLDIEGDSQFLIPTPCPIHSPSTRPGRRVGYTFV